MTIEEFSEQLAPIYLAERWTWGGGPARYGDGHIPDAKEIARAIRDLIESAQEHGECESGGLIVTKQGDAFRVVMRSKKHGRPEAVIPTERADG